MGIYRKLPPRESVFVASLLYHGFRLSRRRKDLHYRRGYVIPATKKEDSGGVDFWVKMPNDRRIFPVQVTQRGVKLYRYFQNPSPSHLREFIERSTIRIEKKRRLCKKHGIAFVLVRDYVGRAVSRSVAWGDMKALKHAIAHLRRWL